jgi:hypothetical protein
LKALNDLEIGAPVKFGSIHGKPIIWRTAAKNHIGFPDNSVTLVSDRIIKLICFDAKEPDADYGNNRYKDANIRRWLNSNGAPGGWYKPSHKKDAPPSRDRTTANPYVDFAGFLAGFNAAEQSAILETEIKSIEPGKDKPSLLSDKVFLLSSTEVGLEHKGEGTILPLFEDKNNLKCFPTGEAVKNSDKKWPGIEPDKPWYYWLRTSYGSSYVRLVYTDGSTSVLNAFDGNSGVRPACNLLSSNLVSEPDQNGIVSIMFDVRERGGKRSVNGESLELKAGRDLFDDYFVAAINGLSISALSGSGNIKLDDIEDLPNILVHFAFEITRAALKKRKEYFSEKERA